MLNPIAHLAVRAAAFARRHKHGEEEAAVAIDFAWIAWRIAGAAAFGASVASAAILVTSSGPTYHPSFSLSTKGAAFITRNEGVRYHPYNDPSGKPICTVGVGHVLAWRGCTAAELRSTYSSGQVTALLLHDAASAQMCVRGKITHPIDQPQFDALVDLTFNAGCGSLDYSGIANEINRGALSAVPGTLARPNCRAANWTCGTAVTAGGRYLSGMYTRRLAEGVLFGRGDYGPGIGRYVPKPPRSAKPAPGYARCAGIEWPRPRKVYTSYPTSCRSAR
jgi:GH24 family phage-related lysozyme (muramidase)